MADLQTERRAADEGKARQQRLGIKVGEDPRRGGGQRVEPQHRCGLGQRGADVGQHARGGLCLRGGERGERGFERVNAKVQREAREVRQVGVFERLEYQRAIRDIGVRPIVGQGQAQALRFGWRAARGRIRHGAGCGGGPHYDFKMHRQRNLLERGEVAGLLPFETRQQLRTHPTPHLNGV